MFLLKQGRMVLVLVTIFGMMILLPDLYIQPAQADGEGGPAETGVQAEVVAEIVAALQGQTKARAQAGSEPANGEGAMCYQCVPCKSNTDLGNAVHCNPPNDTCVWGEMILNGELKVPVRYCAPSAEADIYSCDKFIRLPEQPDKPELANIDIDFRMCGPLQ